MLTENILLLIVQTYIIRKIIKELNLVSYLLYKIKYYLIPLDIKSLN